MSADQPQLIPDGARRRLFPKSALILLLAAIAIVGAAIIELVGDSSFSVFHMLGLAIGLFLISGMLPRIWMLYRRQMAPAALGTWAVLMILLGYSAINVTQFESSLNREKASGLTFRPERERYFDNARGWALSYPPDWAPSKPFNPNSLFSVTSEAGKGLANCNVRQFPADREIAKLSQR